MLQEFVENVERVCRDVMNELHTALPGIIKSVDLSTGMATVSPAGFFKKPTGETIEYPKISGVPIVMPQCVAAAIEFAFPVKAGKIDLKKHVHTSAEPGSESSEPKEA